MASIIVKASPWNGYGPRTFHNAMTADLTVAIAVSFLTAGEKLTEKAAKGKYIAIPLLSDPLESSRALYRQLKRFNVKTLNVAGNGIYTLVKNGFNQTKLDRRVLEILQKALEHHPIEKIVSGGQTGVDLSGLIVGNFLGIDVEATLPRGFVQRNAEGIDVKSSEEKIIEMINAGVMSLRRDWKS